MDKERFIMMLGERLNLTREESVLVSDALDDNFFLSKSNKEATVKSIMNNIKVDEDKASDIYETCVSIVKEEIKNKLKHPFRSQD
ncbi:MAG: hypothetical protein IJ565_00950 [Bacilli bacterium]|nr:hypothetical protein [Bacilli bacterium]